jgi:Flp pilus assembly protein TadD
MRIGVARAVLFGLAGLLLASCVTNDNGVTGAIPADLNAQDAQASASASEAARQNPGDTTGAIPEQVDGVNAQAGLLGSNPGDDLSQGKKNFRDNNFGMAEKYFRRAVEQHPRDAEAWIGLAACYDRLRRFDLADRAYAQAIRIVGPTIEIMNNQGYSYMLRGDYKRARATLVQAQRKDPGNKYVENNLRLLEESYRKGKGIE